MRIKHLNLIFTQLPRLKFKKVEVSIGGQIIHCLILQEGNYPMNTLRAFFNRAMFKAAHPSVVLRINNSLTVTQHSLSNKDRMKMNKVVRFNRFTLHLIIEVQCLAEGE